LFEGFDGGVWVGFGTGKHAGCCQEAEEHEYREAGVKLARRLGKGKGGRYIRRE
jgi:hypothetical protein